MVYKKDYDEVKFLILHKNNWWNGWELVRGEKKEAESIQDAAMREVNHETGLNINKITPINFNYSYKYLKGLNKISASVSCFIAKTVDEMVTLSDEHNYYKWVSYNRALNLLEFEEQKKLLGFVYDLITR